MSHTNNPQEELNLFAEQRYHVVLDNGTDFYIKDLNELTVGDKAHLRSIVDTATNCYSRDAVYWHDVTPTSHHRDQEIS